jgi:hypothetical protein
MHISFIVSMSNENIAKRNQKTQPKKVLNKNINKKI